MKNITENIVTYTSVIAFCSIGLLALTPFLSEAESKSEEDLLATTMVEEVSLNDNKKRAKKFYEAWNAHNPAALDAVLADNYKMHNNLPGVTPDREGMKQWVASTIAAFPDIHFTIDMQVAEGDLVVTQWSATGTHKGELMGMPATGRNVKVSGISIVRFKGGLSVESWGEWDALGMMQQIGPRSAGN